MQARTITNYTVYWNIPPTESLIPRVTLLPYIISGDPAIPFTMPGLVGLCISKNWPGDPALPPGVAGYAIPPPRTGEAWPIVGVPI